MKRIVWFVYGVLSYALSMGAILYWVGFFADFGVPKTVDTGGAGAGTAAALAINSGLILLFGLQHSVMARPGWKRWLTRAVPRPIERATYMLWSVAGLVALYVFWQPLPYVIWSFDGVAAGALIALFVAGVAVLLYATFLIDHFHLFGLAQVWRALRGTPEPATPFRTPSLYRHVRHPIYVGWLTILWATPEMTAGHLLAAAGFTAYILVAIRYEERDLTVELGEAYASYRETTPMLVPRIKRATAPAAGAARSA